MVNIVFISGFMTDATIWDEVMPALQPLGPVMHVDLNRATTITEMAHLVLAETPDQFILIGFSMGGYVAREVVRLAPHRVKALVLVATSARGDTPGQARRKATAANAIDPERFHGLSRSTVIDSLHRNRADDGILIERVRAMSARIGGEVFVRQARHARKGDLQELAAIHCPTLIVAGDDDRLRSLEEARELQRGIAGAALTLIKDCGHMIPIEQPGKLVGAIVPWLRETLTQ